MHGNVTTGAHIAGDLIGHTAGLLITALLLVLTLRAARLPGTPRANVIFAVCAFLWSAGNLAYSAMIASGMRGHAHLLPAARALHFSGAVSFPIAILSIWGRYAVQPWQQRTAHVLQVYSWVSAAALGVVLWTGALWTGMPARDLMEAAIALHTPLLLVLGAIVLLRRSAAPRSVYFPSVVIVGSLCAATLSMFFDLFRVGMHLVLLMVVCAYLLFARFRYADTFIRYTVRLLLAAFWATAVVLTAQSSMLMHLAHRAHSPPAVHVFIVVLVANVLLLSFSLVDERISTALNRWLFHSPDYRARSRESAERFRGLQNESEIASAVEDVARRTLDVENAALIALDTLPVAQWPAGVAEGEIVELDAADPLRALLPLGRVEWLVPVAAGGGVQHVLLIAVGGGRPALITTELNFLRTLATQCGNRMDALRLEREAAERHSRETLLLQQVTEAELRALSAQINPHFLFNSLNTIADLIVRDPPRAEAMTLRLASVFRHVLAHSSRPMTSVRDEMEFLRTYLFIEEARFGDRLQVEIDIAPEIGGEQIPSLILQPLVENALKHGLGPKVGAGHLWISAESLGDRVRLRVEDDGLGLRPERPTGEGLGLSNVADRLRAMYQDRAELRLEPREPGGSRATVIVPRSGGVR